LREKYRLSGWLLLQDIAGYTAFSEKLRKKGKEGVEELTEILNSFLSEQEKIIEENGGYIFKLAGDAFFAALPPFSRKKIEGLSRRLIDNVTLRKYNLKSRIVGVRGDFSIHSFSISSGVDLLPSGNVVKVLMNVEDITEAGKIELKELKAKGRAFKKPHEIEKIRVPQISITYRPEVVTFLRLKTDDVDKIRNIVAYILKETSFAFIGKIVPYKDGVMILILYSFPHSTGKEKELSLRFSLDMEEYLNKQEIDFGIGTSYDFVYTGVVGGMHFKEIDFIGDGVNIAARLATQENGKSLFTQEIIKGLRTSYSFSILEKVHLKGKKEPVNVYEVRKEEKSEKDTDFVDREEELELLKNAISHGERILIKGEAGTGKTRLIKEAIRHIQEDRVIFTRGFPNDPPLTSLKTVLSQLPENIVSEYPVLLDIIQGKKVNFQDEDSILPMFVHNAIEKSRKKLIVMDDFHWIDSISRNILLKAIKDSDVSVIATVRSEYIEKDEVKGFKTISLTSLSKEHTEKLLRNYFGKDVSLTLLSTVYERSLGIPFLVEQFAEFIKEKGLVIYREKTVDLKDTRFIDIPIDAFSLILARYDLLPENEKKLIRVASCFANEWDLKEVKEVAGKNVKTDLNVSLKSNFIKRVSDNKYAFSHSLLRETIYAGIFGKRRKYIHRRIARIFKKFGHSAYEIAMHYFKGGCYRKSDFYFKEAFLHLLNMGFHREAGKVIEFVKDGHLKEFLRAHLFLHYGEYEKAEETIKSILRYRKGRKRVELLLLLSSVYDFWSRYDRMFKVLKSLKRYEKYMNRKHIYTYYEGWGIYYDMTGERRKALKYYFKTLDIASTPEERSTSFYNIGWIYFTLKDYQKAEHYLKKCLQKEPENRMTKAWVYLRLGEIEFVRKHYDRARFYLEESLHNYYISGYSYGIFLSIAPLISLYTITHDKEALKELYLMVKDVIESNENILFAFYFASRQLKNEDLSREIYNKLPKNQQKETQVLDLIINSKLEEALNLCQKNDFKYTWCRNLNRLISNTSEKQTGLLLLIKSLYYPLSEEEKEELHDILTHYLHVPLYAVLVEKLKEKSV